MKIKRKYLYLLFLFVICLGFGVVLKNTYAKFTSGYETGNDIANLNLSFNLKISNLEEYEEITVDKGDYEVFNVNVKNSSGSTSYYGIWYQMVNPKEKSSDIVIARSSDSTVNTSGSISNGGDVTTTIIVKNNSSSNIKVNIGVASSLKSTSDIEYLGGKKLISGTTSTEFSVQDLSYRYHDGKVYGALLSKSDGTIKTDGVDDYVDAGYSMFDFGNSISLVARFKWLQNNNVENEIIDNFEGAGTGLYIVSSGKAVFSVNVSGTYYKAISSSTVSLNQWYTVVGTYDGSTVKLYLNGNLVGSTSISGNIRVSPAPFYLGANPAVVEPTSSIGYKDSSFTSNVYSDILVFNRTLSSDEITSNYSSTITRESVNRNWLLFYYDFSSKLSYSTLNDFSYMEYPAKSFGTLLNKSDNTFTTDGVDDYVDLGYANYDFGHSISLVARFKWLENNGVSNDIINNFEGAGSGIYISSDSKLVFMVKVGGAYYKATSSSTVNLNQWYTAVGTYDGSTAKIYLDGSLVGSVSISGSITVSPVPFYLGANPAPSYATGEFTKNTYSDVMIYDTALSASDISSLFSGEIVASNISRYKLLSYYNLNNATYTNKIRDLSFYQNEALNHGATIDQSSGTVTLDGDDDYINVGYSNYDLKNAVTLVARFKWLQNNNVENEIINNFEGAGVGLYVDSNGKAVFSVNVSGTYYKAISSSNVNLNQWYTVVGTYDGSTVKLYLNGSLAASISASGNINASPYPFIIGGNPDWNGVSERTKLTLSDVLGYNKVYSASDISSLFNGEIDHSKVSKVNALFYYDFK